MKYDIFILFYVLILVLF